MWGEATYKGEVTSLQGKTALVKSGPDNDHIFVQFDDIELGPLAYGWHLFPRTDFDVEEYFEITEENKKAPGN